MSKHIPYKYRIHELMQRLPHKDYTVARRKLPEVLGVSPHTFHKWQWIKQNSGRMIPAEYMYQLAGFFGVTVEEMFTNPPKVTTVKDLRDRCETAQQLLNI